ncbi:hypothetical protein BS47DRAFT_740953 [Hydnum rufescens UP504]|uniref:Uncharacterized protein n=1 Tax=Hydnum rufescens UP504 TaxID=1448309 RepID=A0A9P6B107_9AGAM|nr:hypothetical protein BS47DRAFT_740953 [Hydnum rufescens UP504]
MFENDAPKRTMWRITSNNDFVATGLPEYGDYLQILDPRALKTDRSEIFFFIAASTLGTDNNFSSIENNFFFSHLGSEIVLYDYPHSSDVTGNHITHDHDVVIDSDGFTHQEVAAFHSKKISQFGEYIREGIASALQQIPLLGRFLAHSTVNYWDQLRPYCTGSNASGLSTDQ